MLRQICESIIIPNLALRQDDEETFEEDPAEYIRKDIEGSDADTRRNTSIELVKALLINYDNIVTPILLNRANALFQQYMQAPQSNWKAKDAAIYLIIAVGTKSATRGKGVMETNKLVNITDIFSTHIAPELQQELTSLPVLKADALKFVATFRNQLPKAYFNNLFPLVVKFLKAEQQVVYTYAAWTIERLLVVKDGQVSRYTKDDLKPFAQLLLPSLFSLLTKQDDEDNEYVMKAIMRVSAVLKDEMGPFLATYVTSLSSILHAKAKNPKNPTFNHYMFESFATVIKFNPKVADQFEKFLFPIFHTILQNDVQGTR